MLSILACKYVVEPLTVTEVKNFLQIATTETSFVVGCPGSLRYVRTSLWSKIAHLGRAGNLNI